MTHRVLLRSAEKTVGEMELRHEHLDPQGRVHPATLFGFAYDIAVECSVCHAGSSRLLDAKTVHIHSRAANRLTAEATRVTGSEMPRIWHVTLSDDQDNVLAVFMISFLDDSATPEEPSPRPQPPAPTGQPTPARPEDPTPPESRLDRIVAAAADVIARKGFAQATIREIAEAAELHVPTLYVHVRGKDELLELVYAKEMDLLQADLDQVVGQGTPRERVERMISIAITVGDRRRQQVGLLNRELKHLSPEARARTLSRYWALIGRYEAVVRDGIESGDFAPVDPLVAANFLDMASDIWSLRQFFFSDIQMEDYRRAAIAFALHGLCGSG